jgi:diguanylate cyclase (GGDEF)-like protein
MESKTKLLIVVALMLFGLTIATIINVSLNFKSYSINSAIDKANITANIVKDGLTAHMVNGIMDKRHYFLDKISQNSSIDSLWVSRSPAVIKQYGEGDPSEAARDKIDIKVMETGIPFKEIQEDVKKSILRVTIPYKAGDKVTSLNCMQCHDVKVGDTLGIISMEFDITSMRYDGIFTILKIFGINVIFLIIVLLFINHYITPYTKMFSDMQEGIEKASFGNFTHKFKTSVKGEASNIVSQLNILFEKMQDTFGDIQNSLATFIPGGTTNSNNPLHEADLIINELADIYKFKKTIESDANKDTVYIRIIDILKHKYNIKNMAFYEVNSIASTRKLIHITQGETICFKDVDSNAKECRAYRTKNSVISTEFRQLCQHCDDRDLNYICLPFVINTEVSMLLSITAKTESELNEIKSSLTSIKNYLEAAKPVLESKILMEKLRDTSLRDGMTGLYNRRFLEEFIDKVMGQAAREKETYTVMMLDVDFFKMVNDTYGHDVGDKVIVEIGKLLNSTIRNSDLAIRYGGEEFVVMLHNATDDGAMEVAQKIHSTFASLVFDVGGGEQMQKTMSIGISKFPHDGETIWKSIKYADTALYKAKTTGRNKIVRYKKEMSEEENVR